MQREGPLADRVAGPCGPPISSAPADSNLMVTISHLSAAGRGGSSDGGAHFFVYTDSRFNPLSMNVTPNQPMMTNRYLGLGT